MQALEDQFLADGHDAIGGRGRDLRLLDRLVNGVGLLPAALQGIAPHADLGRLADSPGDRRADAGERLDEELADSRGLGFLEHADQAAQLDAVGMRLDLARFRRQGVGHPRPSQGPPSGST